MKYRKLILILLIIGNLAIWGSGNLNAQKLGLKTNFIGDATLSPNLALEVGMSRKWTFDLSGEFNFWNVNQKTWKHWVVQPEFRYWFCERFTGNFIGFHALGGEYNFGNINNNLNFLGSDFRNLKDKRYQGWGAGLGIVYGHAWMLSDHWNLEAVIGIGWIYTRYDAYPCAECGDKLESNKPHNYFGPTKLALSLEYLF